MDKLEKINRDYKNYIWKISYSILGDSHLAEDASQEVLLILSRSLDKLDLDSPSSLGFITVVTRHKAFEIYKREKRYQLGIEEDLSDYIPEEIDYSSELLSAIHALNPLYSTVLILGSVYGYSDKEIADILGISHGAVRKRKERARNELEKIYFGEEGESEF